MGFVTDEQVELMIAELTRLRAELHAATPAAHFLVKVMYGKPLKHQTWKPHHGYGGCVVMSHAHALHFADTYLQRQTSTYQISVYGKSHAQTAAQQWVKKAEYYYGIWQSRGGGPVVFDAADIAGFHIDAEFARCLASTSVQGAALGRLHMLRDWVPQAA